MSIQGISIYFISVFLCSCLPFKISEPTKEEVRQTESQPLRYSGNLYNVNELVTYYEKISEDPVLKSKRVEEARNIIERTQKDGWGESAKGFASSIDSIPTNEGLLNYAMSQIMTNVQSSSVQESLSTKVRNFEDVLQLYQVTVEFSRRTRQPLSKEQKEQIEVNAQCIETFLKSSDIKAPPCKLVDEALKASKIQ